MSVEKIAETQPYEALSYARGLAGPTNIILAFKICIQRLLYRMGQCTLISQIETSEEPQCQKCQNVHDEIHGFLGLFQSQVPRYNLRVAYSKSLEQLRNETLWFVCLYTCHIVGHDGFGATALKLL